MLNSFESLGAALRAVTVAFPIPRLASQSCLGQASRCPRVAAGPQGSRGQRRFRSSSRKSGDSPETALHPPNP
jgi:hypothetical protein